MCLTNNDEDSKKKGCHQILSNKLLLIDNILWYIISIIFLWIFLTRISVKRRANINGLSVHLSSILKHRFQFGVNHPYHYRILKLFNLQYYEAYLAVLYIMIKIFYLCNVIGQVIQIFLCWIFFAIFYYF